MHHQRMVLPRWCEVLSPNAGSSLAVAYAYDYFAYIIYAHYVYPRRQKKVLDSLELELQMVVSHQVGTGNQTQVPSAKAESAVNH